MVEEHKDGGSSPSPCHLENCDDEVYIACPHCLEFVCYSHIDDHGCRGHQLQEAPVMGNMGCNEHHLLATNLSEKVQTTPWNNDYKNPISIALIIKENALEANTFQLLMVMKMLVQVFKLKPSDLQKIIASYFTPETLNRLSSNRKWYDYITSNRLWQKYCQFPEMYWKEADTKTALLKKQQFRPFSLWKYNYDSECHLLKNWELGKWKVKQLGVIEIKEKIRLIKVVIDSFGEHWLFIIVNVTMYILEIRNEPRLHFITTIQYFEYTSLLKIDIFLSNEKLFIICGNLIDVYAFNNPEYIPQHLYGFICNDETKMQNYCQEEIIDLLNSYRIRDFCIYVMDSVIMGLSGFTHSGNIDIHIWDSSSGNKIIVVTVPLPNTSDVVRAYVKSVLCPLECCVLLNAALYLSDGTEMTFLMVLDIKDIAHCSCHIPASLSLAVRDYSETNLVTYQENLSENIIFCEKLSRNVIITCRQHNRELEFQIFEIKDGQRNDLWSFTEPLKNSLFVHFIKIHLFKGMGQRNDILCIAVENCRIKVVNLNTSISQQSLKSKNLCRVQNVKKIYFIDPKFVLVFDKENIGEIWDAEEGQIITSVCISNDEKCINVFWHKMNLVPPTKLIIYTINELYIINFEQN